ncbi:peptidase M61 [Fulvivirgaceae bacterium BMA10]|uniref:Peptidase M61 n=1 Tax=Splendidivirga corallicola TaxID=3051826 RepID=A0ABT8KQ48_9BACT|nr:peptidase M61 [Fulvivirgaceae bacterium BMA10]
MKYSTTLFALLIGITSFATEPPVKNKYQYILDLTKVQDDKLMVELLTPAIKESELIFYMPKIIPGTYKEADYGRFVSDLKAFDKKGRELEVERSDDNTWKITKAKKLSKITYWVEDTYDSEIKEKAVYPMAGTNIEDQKNFVINTSGFFGYIKGKKELGFDLKVIRPESLYGSTGLIASETGMQLSVSLDSEGLKSTDVDKVVDHYEVENYHLLIDSPIMYNEPDTTIINVANAEVLVSVYSPSGQVTSKYIAENVEEILYAQASFLGGELPVEKYAFIFYCEELSKLAPIQGALEHSYSSFYYFPDVPQENLKQTVRDVAAHEFFHIVTPLNIHSEEIQYFDFNEPKMSQHLWLYEGVTEYFSDLVQIKYDIIDLDQYVSKLSEKMSNASFAFNDTLSFTDLSKYTIDKYPDQYGNVYEKGALIAMTLDIKLRALSDGKYGIQNLIDDLEEKYGKDTPFKDGELFEEIVSLTYPEIGEFFETYLIKGGVLPYEETLALVGINYVDREKAKQYSFGNVSLGFDQDEGKLKIAGTSNMNAFGEKMGYKTGDVLLKINDEEIPLQNLQQYFDDLRTNMKEGDEFAVTVLRKSEGGGKEEVRLSTEIFQVEVEKRHQISINENPSQEQLKIRDSWLKP